MTLWSRHKSPQPDVAALLDRRLEELDRAVRELEDFAQVFHNDDGDSADGEADGR